MGTVDGTLKNGKSPDPINLTGRHGKLVKVRGGLIQAQHDDGWRYCKEKHNFTNIKFPEEPLYDLWDVVKSDNKLREDHNGLTRTQCVATGDKAAERVMAERAVAL